MSATKWDCCMDIRLARTDGKGGVVFSLNGCDVPEGIDLFHGGYVDTLRAQLEAAQQVIAEAATTCGQAQARAEAAEAECARLRGLLKETSAVGITMLFDSHADDVRAEFSTGELLEVVAISDPLNANGAQVEKVYRAAWNAARTKEQQA